MLQELGVMQMQKKNNHTTTKAQIFNHTRQKLITLK
jgi:hypothetical protein